MNTCLLGDAIASSRSGFASGKRSGDGVVQLRMNNVRTDGTLNLASVIRVPATKKQVSELSLTKGDVLFNSTNSPELVGKTCLFNGFAESVVFSNHFVRLRTRPGRLLGDYLARWLTWTRDRGVFTHGCVRWVNQATFKKDDLLRLRIPLPPLAEQKRIAAILDAADALRAARRESLAQLDILLQSTFLDMFGDPVTNPKEWEVVAFESIGNSRLGKMLDKGKEVGDCQFPYLANTNVQWGRFDLAALRTMDFSESDCEEFKLEDGDLLICEGGEVGRTAIWHGAHDRIYFQKALHRVRLDPTVAVPEYVFQFMWFMAKNGGFRNLTTSATIAHLTGVKLKRLPCPRPPLELQHRFAAIVKSVERQKASQRAHLAELDTLSAALQSRAFWGDL